MAAITPEDAHTYRERWSLMKAFEIEELRRTPMETKLQQLASLMASRNLFADDPRREKDAREVWHRWSRLRQVQGG